MRTILAATCLLLLAGAAPAAPMRVERVVMLMRHGVRPPTKAPAMPAGTAAGPWPAWDVAPGELTTHGAAAIRLLGAQDRRDLVRSRLLPAGACPPAGTVAIYSDSDQRTIATGDAWARGFAGGCALLHAHRPQDVPDPTFSAIESGLVNYDPVAATAATAAAMPPGGLPAVETRERGALDRLDAILCGGRGTPDCGVNGKASTIAPARAATRPKLAGALDRGSTAAQILLLEYAEGKAGADYGWGRATAADVANLGTLHATEFALLARPPYIAARNLAPIARRMRDALAPDAPKLSVIVGHDTNIANLAGLLDLHWRTPGFSADDPVPGGAVMIAVMRDAAGARYVRLTYRAQSLEAIRHLRGDAATAEPLHVAACDPRGDGLCPLPAFERLLDQSARLLR